MPNDEALMPPRYRPKPLWKRLFNLAVLGGLIYGIYYAWQTGEFLKALDWLLGQDIMVLTIVSVVALIAVIIGLRGV